MSGELSPTKRESLISDILQDEAELQRLLNKKNDLLNTLHELDAKIYRLETSYLDETRMTGNVIKGFDQYMIEPSASGGNPTQQSLKRSLPIDPSERIFSNSSARPLGGMDKKLDKVANNPQVKSNPSKAISPNANEATSHNKGSRNRSSSDRTSPVVIRLPNTRLAQPDSSKPSESLTPPRIRITLRTSPQDTEHASRDNEGDLEV